MVSHYWWLPISIKASEKFIYIGYKSGCFEQTLVEDFFKWKEIKSDYCDQPMSMFDSIMNDCQWKFLVKSVQIRTRNSSVFRLFSCSDSHVINKQPIVKKAHELKSINEIMSSHNKTKLLVSFQCSHKLLPSRHVTFQEYLLSVPSALLCSRHPGNI